MKQHNIDERQLVLPLLFFEDAPVCQFEQDEQEQQEEQQEEPICWTDAEVRMLRDNILWDSLQALSDLRSKKEKKEEAMAWVMSDDILPFSFLVCCWHVGYDPLIVREGVKANLSTIN